MSHEDKDAFGTYGDNRAGARYETPKRPGPELMGVDTLVGSDVYNLESEDIGDIKEIMLDMRSGRVGYAVLSFKPFLSLREKLFAVPWGALTLDSEHKRFTLNLDKDRLKDAPRFRQKPLAQYGGSNLGERDSQLLSDEERLRGAALWPAPCVGIFVRNTTDGRPLPHVNCASGVAPAPLPCLSWATAVLTERPNVRRKHPPRH